MESKEFINEFVTEFFKDSDELNEITGVEKIAYGTVAAVGTAGAIYAASKTLRKKDLEATIKALNAAKKTCSTTKNPEKCVEKLNNQISKAEGHLKKINDKIASKRK